MYQISLTTFNTFPCLLSYQINHLLYEISFLILYIVNVIIEPLEESHDVKLIMSTLSINLFAYVHIYNYS
jgi:hypothetical protein